MKSHPLPDLSEIGLVRSASAARLLGTPDRVLRKIASAPGSLALEPTRIGPGVGKTHYHPDAPWPAFRGDLENTGCHHVLLRHGVSRSPEIPMRPQHFPTGNAIFSTPIIGPREQVLVGSADKIFRSFDPKTGSEEWAFATGECIDSAACMDENGHIYVPSCDGKVYVLDEGGVEQKAPFDTLKDHLFTSSTIFWNEANSAIGPSGRLFFGNDNYYLNAVDRRDMKLAWASTTGLNTWSTPCFDAAGQVFTGSFDMRVYALDEATGRVKWHSPAGNLIASSPALDRKTGKIYVGNFAGEILAFQKDTGKMERVAKTGGAIYASMAIAPDGLGYVGSADGLMYAVDLEKKEVVGTFDTGSPIRSSAVIGPDPERKKPYLVYFGGGNGLIYALEPRDVRRRFSYDTRRPGAGSEYPNINASLALGRHGLATASASGDVIYLPYHYYLSGDDLPGIDLRPDDGFPADGAFLQYVSPGGTQADGVLSDDAEGSTPLAFDAGQTVSLELINRAEGRTLQGSLVPGSLEVTIDPPLLHEVSIQPSGQQVNVVPTEIPTPGQTYSMRVSAKVETPDAAERSVGGTIALRAPHATETPAISALKDMPFRISHMSMYDPSIVPSFDQIGIASLSIDTRVVDVDEATGAVSAWGVLKFGSSEDGSTVGVPDGRELRFALGGRYAHGQLMLEAKKPWFEITAFPVPLERLRFSGRVPVGDDPVDGGSLFASVRVPSLGETAKRVLFGEKPAALRVLAKMDAKKKLNRTWGQWFRSFLPARSDRAYLGSMATQLVRTGRLATDALLHNPHRSWELMDAQGTFTGVGTFRSTPLSGAALEDPRSLANLQGLSHDVRRGTVTARLKTGERYDEKTAVPSLLLVDAATGAPVPLDYNFVTHSLFDRREKTVEVSLHLPRSVRLSGMDVKAIALVDTTPVGEATLGR